MLQVTVPAYSPYIHPTHQPQPNVTFCVPKSEKIRVETDEAVKEKSKEPCKLF